MKSCFFDGRRTLRNGWKILAWLAIAAGLIAILLAGRALLPPHMAAGLPRIGVIFLGVLIASWLCVRLERQSLASIGLRLDGRFARQFGAGLAWGAGLVALVAAAVWLAGGYHLVPVPGASLSMLGTSALTMLGIATIETLVFCGYPFQRAIRGMGRLRALLLFGLLFCAGHILDPDTPPAMMIIIMSAIFLAGLLFAFCYLGTGSLALPIGVHMGWNWAQSSLGFSVSGNAANGWWTPVYHGRPEWLTGGAFGLEGSVFSIVALAGALVVLARWRRASRAAALAAGAGGAQAASRA